MDGAESKPSVISHQQLARSASQSSEIRDQKSAAIVSLPYQPLEKIRYTLPAADLHVVSLGDAMGGIVHPCKIYGALSVGRPVLCLGPEESYLTDILDSGEGRIGWSVRHGDVDGAVAVLMEAAAMSPEERDAMGARARERVATEFGREKLLDRFVATVLGRSES